MLYGEKSSNLALATSIYYKKSQPLSMKICSQNFPAPSQQDHPQAMQQTYAGFGDSRIGRLRIREQTKFNACSVFEAD